MLSNEKFLIGVDEVGRGPIAGPVAVGAFIFLKSQDDKKIIEYFKGVKESKQLSEKKREEWFEKILLAQKENLIDFSIEFQDQKIIDEHGLSYAIDKCLSFTLSNLLKKYNLSYFNTCILLDGGLKAPVQYPYQKTIIRGDEKEMVIALASICAKVLRDRQMKKWAEIYSNYGFELHKGYGTNAHYNAIKKYGLCELHRRSFCHLY